MEAWPPVELRWRRGLHAAFGAAFGALAGALMLGLRRLEALRLAPEIDLAVLEETLEGARLEPVTLCTSLVCDCPTCASQVGATIAFDDDGLSGVHSRQMYGQQYLFENITFVVVFRLRPRRARWSVSLGLASKEMEVVLRSLTSEQVGGFCGGDENFKEDLLGGLQDACVLSFSLAPATGVVSVFRVTDGGCVALAGDAREFRPDASQWHPLVIVLHGRGVSGAVQILQFR